MLNKSYIRVTTTTAYIKNYIPPFIIIPSFRQSDNSFDIQFKSHYRKYALWVKHTINIYTPSYLFDRKTNNHCQQLVKKKKKKI